MMSNIRKRLTPQAIKLRADIEVSCFGYDGIDAVKSALLAGQDLSTPQVPLKIRLVAPPLYVMVSTCIDKQIGLQTLNDAISKIEQCIKLSSGTLVVKMKPRAVSESDEAELAKLMEKMELENTEIDGDSDGSDSFE